MTFSSLPVTSAVHFDPGSSSETGRRPLKRSQVRGEVQPLWRQTVKLTEPVAGLATQNKSLFPSPLKHSRSQFYVQQAMISMALACTPCVYAQLGIKQATFKPVHLLDQQFSPAPHLPFFFFCCCSSFFPPHWRICSNSVLRISPFQQTKVHGLCLTDSCHSGL